MQVMFENCMKWRAENGVEDIIDTYKFDERELVQEVYPHGYHMCDK